MYHALRRRLPVRSRSPRAAFAIVLAILLSAGGARAAIVTVTLPGIVTIEHVDTPGIEVGDPFRFSFTYEIDSNGVGSPDDFANQYSYRSFDIVTSSTATIGDTVLNGPVENPILQRSSLISVEDGTPLGLPDLFQGSVNFPAVDGIPNPVLAFYLYDESGTRFGPHPRHLTQWDESELANFNRLQFILFDYSVQGGVELARGRIFPEPTSACLLLVGLSLWQARRLARRR